MGMDTSEQDMNNIVVFTDRMISLALYRKQLYSYLEAKMSTVAPNLSALIGETVAARYHPLQPSRTSSTKPSPSKTNYFLLSPLILLFHLPNTSSLPHRCVVRLIQKAGSLTSLAKCPASTVQILGAEKALFRALKTKGNTPK